MEQVGKAGVLQLLSSSECEFYFSSSFIKMTHLPVGGEGVCGKLVLSYMHCTNGLNHDRGGGFFVVMLSSAVGS